MSTLDPSASLQRGWNVLKTHTAPLLLGALLVDFLSGRLGANGSGGSGGDIDWDTPPTQDTGGVDFQFQAQDPLQQLEVALQGIDGVQALAGGTLLIGLTCFTLFSLFWLVARCFILGGWYRLHQHALQDQGGFNHLFSGGEVLGPMVRLKLLEGLIYGGITLMAGAAAFGILLATRQLGDVAGVLAATVGFGVFAPVAGFVYLRTFAAGRLLALGSMDATQALVASWRLTGANLLGFAVFLGAMVGVYWVVFLLSCCLCCFSFVASIPLRAVVDTAVTDGVAQAWAEHNG